MLWAGVALVRCPCLVFGNGILEVFDRLAVPKGKAGRFFVCYEERRETVPDIVYIYALIDPRDFSYRYIGKTIDPERRERNHLQYAADPQVPKDWWVRKLLEMGEEPIFRVVMEVPDECWAEAEISTIAYFRRIGAPLLNLTDGGDGLHGYEWNE